MKMPTSVDSAAGVVVGATAKEGVGVTLVVVPRIAAKTTGVARGHLMEGLTSLTQLEQTLEMEGL